MPVRRGGRSSKDLRVGAWATAGLGQHGMGPNPGHGADYWQPAGEHGNSLYCEKKITNEDRKAFGRASVIEIGKLYAHFLLSLSKLK